MTFNKPLFIIDGYGFIFRAYHVQPPLSSPSGIPVGAIYGLTSMLLKLIGDFKPEKAVMVLDSGQKNFRHEIYDRYKAHRPLAPEDLVLQLKMVKNAARSLNFHVIEKAGYEADDIIASLAEAVTSRGKEAVIVSSDKDLTQLINGHIKIYDPVKSKYISREDVIAKFGVEPDKIREVQALTGDASDNIPGVKGIGPKTAAILINQFGSVQNLLNSLEKIKNQRQREIITRERDKAILSWKLAGLKSDIDLNVDIESLTWAPPSSEVISSYLRQFGFKSLVKRFEKIFSFSLDEYADNSDNPVNIREKSNLTMIEIKDKTDIDNLLKQINKTGITAIDLVSAISGTQVVISPSDNQLYNFTISDDVKRLESKALKGDLLSYFGKPDIDNIWLKELLCDPSIKKITYNLKNLLKYFANWQIVSCEDLQIMYYCFKAGQTVKTVYEIIKEFNIITNNDYFPTPITIIADYAKCYQELLSRLIKAKSLHLYNDIDLPICHILRDMEKTGIKVNIAALKGLSVDFDKEITKLGKEIFTIVGQEFNIASPKQLGEILFEKMRLPFGKIGGKSKSYLTSAEILEKLSESGYKIADLLLKYRHFAKLKSTYTDALAALADPTTNRIHTTFLQTVTATGRLSSNNPNVQNIPIRGEESDMIRKAFIASEGHRLISADYSQIELRILSYIADIPSLKEAFIKGRDIHKQTASQIFGIDQEKVTPEQRRNAKAINFGIIYGISAFGLARQLNISQKEAYDYIEKYFQEYPGIKEYMEKIKDFAHKHGYTENLIGRRCYLADINNNNKALRAFSERAAINAPLQSLTADIVKIAMIKVNQALVEKGFKTKMILQIHDELIFEAPNEEVSSVLPIIKTNMESASYIPIPMVVSINHGRSWNEIH